MHPLEQAKHLLETTTADLGYIALICSLCNRWRLSLAFLRQEGMRPAAYRARYGKPPPKPKSASAPPAVHVTFISPNGEAEEEW